MTDTSTWPEQEAFIKWEERFSITIDTEAARNLIRVMTDIRVEQITATITKMQERIEELEISLVHESPTIHIHKDGYPVWTECRDCGIDVGVDEDGCCTGCGIDALRTGNFSKQLTKMQPAFDAMAGIEDPVHLRRTLKFLAEPDRSFAEIDIAMNVLKNIFPKETSQDKEQS